MTYVFWCVEYIATFTELFLSTIFCGTFIENADLNKNLFKRIIVSSVSTVLMLIINHIELYSPLSVSFSLIVIGLTAFVIYIKHPLKSPILAICFLPLIAILDNIVISAISFTLHIPSADIHQEMSLNRVLAIIASKTLLMIVVVAIYKLFSKKRKLQRKYIIMLLSITTLMLLITVIITFIDIKNNSVNSVISILFFAVMLILFMIIFFGTFKLTEHYENQEELKLTTLKNQMLEQSMSETEQTFMLWKKSMHDYKHNIVNLKTLAQNKDFDGITEYLDNEDKLLNQQLFYYKTGNDTVDSIIYIKQKNAESKNIPFIINAEIPEKCSVTSAHFASILGNLLDNAIEASEKVKQPYIEVKIKTIEDYLVIAISNRCNSQNQLLETNKPNRIFHGIGLSSVRHTVKLYKGEVSVKQKDNIFSVNIMIPLSSNPA